MLRAGGVDHLLEKIDGRQADLLSGVEIHRPKLVWSLDPLVAIAWHLGSVASDIRGSGWAHTGPQAECMAYRRKPIGRRGDSDSGSGGLSNC